MPHKIGIHIIDSFQFPVYCDPSPMGINPDLLYFIISVILPCLADNPSNCTHRERISFSDC